MHFYRLLRNFVARNDTRAHTVIASEAKQSPPTYPRDCFATPLLAKTCTPLSLRAISPPSLRASAKQSPPTYPRDCFATSLLPMTCTPLSLRAPLPLSLRAKRSNLSSIHRNPSPSSFTLHPPINTMIKLLPFCFLSKLGFRQNVF